MPPRPDAKQFRDVAWETLAWVFDDGFEELELRGDERGFSWRLWSERARIWVGVFAGGLADLRATELAGDWSRYDEGRAAIAELRRSWRET